MSCLKNNILRPLMLLAHGPLPTSSHAYNEWKFEAFWVWYEHRGKHKHKLGGELKGESPYSLIHTYAWVAFDQWCSHYRGWLVKEENKLKQAEVT